MPEAPGARFGLAAISGGDHIDDIDAIDQAQVALLEGNAAMYKHGTLGTRPTSSGGTPGKAGRFYLATDQTPQQLSYDTGAGYLAVAKTIGYHQMGGSSTLVAEALTEAGGGTTQTLPSTAVEGQRVWVAPASDATGANPVTISAGSSAIRGPGLSLSGVSSITQGTPYATIGFVYANTLWWIFTGHLDTGWVALTLGTYVVSGDSRTPGVRQEGSLVRLRGALTASGGSPTTWATIPAAFRPPATVKLPVPNASANTLDILQVAVTTGIMTLLGSGAGAWLDDVSFPLD